MQRGWDFCSPGLKLTVEWIAEFRAKLQAGDLVAPARRVAVGGFSEPQRAALAIGADEKQSPRAIRGRRDAGH
ncbi:MAG TPA: hypothetical protein VGG64_17425 [Pirellulales bacterium]